ncbi:MAG: type 1 glutamine amidotransferase [Methanomicrobiaceae archaeon]|nr:type 1 glutamine amidotransferase [Methanomicrobiaceae archaeon]
MRRREVSILQHAKNEHGGLFEEYIRERGMELRHVPIYETNEIPSITTSHLLLMGGPMSVNDEEELPWLKTEKRIIREWVTKGRPVLGICLGAQLIASSFEASVYSCEAELGWSSVAAVNNEIFPGLPERFRVFQMHGETFSIPHGATLVYRGERVANQAMCMGSALGLQFHIELTIEMIQDWISDRPLNEQSYVLSQSRQYLPESQRICKVIADRFLSAPSGNFSWMHPEEHGSW